VEIMSCPGGCVGGGGQPRAEGLYRIDRSLPIRKSHENPEVKALYAGFLGAPLGEKSHRLLHTSYSAFSRD
jgi:NADH-quinone oxidoreductase subunit G/NADP-reducing hydrogenase subunit HndD